MKQIIIYHYPLCPFSRKVRIMMDEYNIPYTLQEEKFWNRRLPFLKINPSGRIPFMIEVNGISLQHSGIICEYISRLADNDYLMADNFKTHTEIRRLLYWFDEKFFLDVSMHILEEKLVKFFSLGLSPDQRNVSNALKNMEFHMKYISHLLSKKKFIADDKLTLADICAASHLSVVDYFAGINWKKVDIKVKNWYSCIKSRKSFSGILKDNVTGFVPPEHYSKIDF